jgi:hypothetical protein
LREREAARAGSSRGSTQLRRNSTAIPCSRSPLVSGHSGARPKAANPKSTLPGGYGFRVRCHSASSTRYGSAPGSRLIR